MKNVFNGRGGPTFAFVAKLDKTNIKSNKRKQPVQNKEDFPSDSWIQRNIQISPSPFPDDSSPPSSPVLLSKKLKPTVSTPSLSIPEGKSEQLCPSHPRTPFSEPFLIENLNEVVSSLEVSTPNQMSQDFLDAIQSGQNSEESDVCSESQLMHSPIEFQEDNIPQLS